MARVAYTRNCTDLFRTVINELETAVPPGGEMPSLNRGASRRYTILRLNVAAYYLALSEVQLAQVQDASFGLRNFKEYAQLPHVHIKQKVLYCSPLHQSTSTRELFANKHNYEAPCRLLNAGLWQLPRCRVLQYAASTQESCRQRGRATQAYDRNDLLVTLSPSIQTIANCSTFQSPNRIPPRFVLLPTY